MSIPIVASWTANNNSGNAFKAITLTKPASIAVGDLLLLIVGNDSADIPIWDDLTGWTKFVNANSAGADANLGCYWRIADGTEDATIEVTCTTEFVDIFGWYIRVTGADTTNPINVIGTPAYVISDTDHIIPSVTTTVNDCLAIYALAWDGGDAGSFSASNTTSVSLLFSWTRCAV